MALAALQAQPPAGGAHEIAELISLIETDVLASAGRVETGAKRAALGSRGLFLASCRRSADELGKIAGPAP